MQNLRVLIHVGADKKKEWGKYWIEQGFNGTIKWKNLYLHVLDLCLIADNEYPANKLVVT